MVRQKSVSGHPNILSLYGWFESDTRIFLIQEFAHERQLSATLNEKKYFSEEEAATHVLSLAKALAYCHQKNVIPGDIKCQNLLLDNKGSYRVGLEIIPKEEIAFNNLKGKIVREMIIQRSLIGHPNILSLYGLIDDPDYVILVLEDAPKDRLSDVLKKRKYFPEEEAATHILCLTKALSYCHDKNVIAGDFKSQDLKICREFQGQDCLKIVDFRRFEDTSGKLDSYSAPEMDVSTFVGDNWTLGSLCYELLYGVPPFEAESQAEALERKLTEGPNFPSSPSVSEGAKCFIRQLLEKDSPKTLSHIMEDPWIMEKASKPDPLQDGFHFPVDPMEEFPLCRQV